MADSKRKLPLVAIIGRPNVGKSTIFNRMLGSRVAIVDEMEGVTRDRLYGECEWEGNFLQVVDCGGIARESADPLHALVSMNAREALNEADLVLFVIDAKAGITAADELVRDEVWKSGKPVLLVANKVDSAKVEAEIHELYALGIEDIAAVSAANGRFFYRLQDAINEKLGYKLPERARESRAERRLRKEELTGSSKWLEDDGAVSDAADAFAEEERGGDADETSLVDAIGDAGDGESGDGPDAYAPLADDESWREKNIHIAVLGRQNVGKSSLVNALINENRIIVSELPGTTRDPIEAEFVWKDRRFSVLDTAGIKKLSRVKESVDFYSMMRTKRRLPEADVIILVIDAVEGVYEMDKLAARKIGEDGKAVVIAVNKWDLAEDAPEVREAYRTFLRANLNKITWANAVFISALKSEGLDELLDAVVFSWEEYHRRIPDDLLLSVMTEEIALHPAPVTKNNPLKIFDLRQVAVRPPVIKFWVNSLKGIHFSYRGFLENTIREHFGFDGTFIRLLFEERKKRARKR